MARIVAKVGKAVGRGAKANTAQMLNPLAP